MGLALVCGRRRPSAQEGGRTIAGWHVQMCTMLKIRSGGPRMAGIQTDQSGIGAVLNGRVEGLLRWGLR